MILFKIIFHKNSFRKANRVSNSLDPDSVIIRVQTVCKGYQQIGLPRLHIETSMFHVFAIKVYKNGKPFKGTLAHDQRRGLLIASSNEKYCCFSRFDCI